MNILELTLEEVTQYLSKAYNKGLYHASALYREVYKYGRTDPFKANEFLTSPKLSKKLKTEFTIAPGMLTEQVKENDLLKFITRFEDGLEVESVIIPMSNHWTLCVSCQVGCKMGCKFCETGRMGFKRNLSVSEITGQVFNARHVLGKNIKNIVFMGMGEPFDNFDNVMQSVNIISQQKGFDIAPRHITISTAGLVSGIQKLAKTNLLNIRLAISINAGNDTVRSKLMPVNQKIPMQRLKEELIRYPLPKRGQFLFEYILIKGVNDAFEDAEQLVEFIKPLKVRLNLIAYNPVKGFDYESPSDGDMHRFADELTRMGVFVIKRWGKGCSVGAGCGQLARGIA